MKIIIPSSDLRNRYNEISNLALKEKAAIYITVNGREDTVLINHTVYENQLAELELLRLLSESDDSFKRNDVIEAKEALEKLRNDLK